MPLIQRDCVAARWVLNWIAELRNAHWKRAADVAGQFPKVRQQDDGTFLFPVPGKQLGIHVLMTFSQGLVLILSIKTCDAADGH